MESKRSNHKAAADKNGVTNNKFTQYGGKRDASSYASVLNNSKHHQKRKPTWRPKGKLKKETKLIFYHLDFIFKEEEEVLSRFKKAYTGVVETSRISYHST